MNLLDGARIKALASPLKEEYVSARVNFELRAISAEIKKLKEAVSSLLSDVEGKDENDVRHIFRVFSALMKLRLNSLNSEKDKSISSEEINLEKLADTIKFLSAAASSAVISYPHNYRIEDIAKQAIKKISNFFSEAFADQYSTSHPFKLHPNIRVEQFNKPLVSASKELIDSLSGIAISFLIDANLGKPQEGFIEPYTSDVLSSYLEQPEASLYVTYLNDKAVGFMILTPDQDGVTAFAPIVAISKEGRCYCHEHGENAYDLLHYSLCETAYYSGIKQVTAEIREGPNANSAKPKHLKRGWEETNDLVYEEGGPYRKLTLDPAKALGLTDFLFRNCPFRLQINFLAHLISDLKFTKKVGIGAINKDSATEIINKLLPQYKIYSAEASDGLFMQIYRSGGRMDTFRQIVPEYDLWYYGVTTNTESNEPKIGTLEEILNWFTGSDLSSLGK
ncbi:MAG: hypothetical protein KDD56_08885 [Bdellovibrionales bacterium]|nr:hypothetical protein [Bdellovibrionales bacterium]